MIWPYIMDMVVVVWSSMLITDGQACDDGDASFRVACHEPLLHLSGPWPLVLVSPPQ